MVVFVTGAPSLNVGHSYGFVGNVVHPRSDSVKLLIYDDVHTYIGY
jgi:hypothetical protein